MSVFEFPRLGIALEHHNLTMKWQVSAVKTKTMLICILQSYFCGKKMKNTQL